MHGKNKLLIATLVLVALSALASHFTSASEVPKVIALDHIGDIYEKVIFDHVLHVEVASCATCHHHTIGTPNEDAQCMPCHKESVEVDVVACKGCHSINPAGAEQMKAAQAKKIFHLDNTGLKRAYHLQCMGCHTEMGLANECKECHAKKG